MKWNHLSGHIISGVVQYNIIQQVVRHKTATIKILAKRGLCWDLQTRRGKEGVGNGLPTQR